MRYPWTLKWFTLGILPLLSFVTTPAQGIQCQPGIILPVWQPQEDLSTLEIIGRGTLYMIALMYMFIGVSVISDRFMGAIEVITSKQREIKIKRSNGESKIVVVRVWNETVANLTLMALGSSAPEILLSVIEIIGKNFEAGELGPGTIVGSAAFNFFVIIAICIIAIPNGETRKIKHLRVFIVTCSWSLFAYIWLLIILKVTSPGIVEIWEGAVTFLFFFATVITAFVADKRLIKMTTLRSYRLNKRGVIVEGEGNAELALPLEGMEPQLDQIDEYSEDVKQFEQNRKQYVDLLWELHDRHPDIDTDSLEVLAREEIFNRAPKSRAFYRIQATRKLVHGQNLNKKLHDRAILEASYLPVSQSDDKYLNEQNTRIGFNPTYYTVMENIGTFPVTVERYGGNLNETVLVEYSTHDGTASANADYIPVNGILTFGPNETIKEISIQVLDDEVFEEDEHFFIKLGNARFSEGHGGNIFHTKKIEIAPNASSAKITIVDDDFAGVFLFSETEVQTNESIGTLNVKLNRASGARGKVLVPYITVAGNAKPGTDYTHAQGNIKFENNETEKMISIPILERNSYEKDADFYIEIYDPIPLDDSEIPLKIGGHMTKADQIAAEGWPKLGTNNRAHIRIKESQAFKNTVDKLLQKDITSSAVGTNSWKEQFVDAVTMESGDDDGGEGGGPTKPSIGDYFLHILTVFWKVLFAFVPPTSILDGYLTFIVSILVIGILTAFIGDIASHMGCTIGLEDSVTAIVFVALGTSVPDTFASKVAAVQDQYADASIGNVTGSNAVNVFLGIGIAWTLAAVVKAFRTCTAEFPDCNVFRVHPGSLALSVSLFCACAVVAIAIMMIRRLKIFGGGELGGPAKFKYPTALLFFFLWIFYVVMSTLEAYRYIQGF